MRFYAQLKSKKEIEADFSKLAMAFIALAEELLLEEDLKESSEDAHLKEDKTLATDPALPLVSGNDNPKQKKKKQVREGDESLSGEEGCS